MIYRGLKAEIAASRPVEEKAEEMEYTRQVRELVGKCPSNYRAQKPYVSELVARAQSHRLDISVLCSFLTEKGLWSAVPPEIMRLQERKR